MAGPDIAAQLIHDDDAQQLGCAVEALVAEEQAANHEDDFQPARRQRTGEAGGAARSVLPSADEDLIDYITTGARPCAPCSAVGNLTQADHIYVLTSEKGSCHLHL